MHFQSRFVVWLYRGDRCHFGAHIRFSKRSLLRLFVRLTGAASAAAAFWPSAPLGCTVHQITLASEYGARGARKATQGGGGGGVGGRKELLLRLIAEG